MKRSKKTKYNVVGSRRARKIVELGAAMADRVVSFRKT
jgi:hypothetical protein